MNKKQFEELKEEIVLYPDSILHQKCEKHVMFGDGLKVITDDMFEKMKKFRGVGLAAPQIGLSETFFVVNVTGKPDGNMVFVNPVVTPVGKMVEGLEGCLSFPDISVLCKRAKKCIIKYLDVSGELKELETSGLLARVIQHENDHINGVTIDSRMTLTDKVMNKKMLQFLEKIAKEAEKIGV